MSTAERRNGEHSRGRPNSLRRDRRLFACFCHVLCLRDWRPRLGKTSPSVGFGGRAWIVSDIPEWPFTLIADFVSACGRQPWSRLNVSCVLAARARQLIVGGFSDRVETARPERYLVDVGSPSELF